MFRRLERRAQELAPRRMVLRAPAEDLPFDDDSFDVAVSTLVLCGVSDQPARCASSRGCCGPAVSCCSSSTFDPTTPGLARRQDRMNGLNRFLVGCECNRADARLDRAAGSRSHGSNT